MMLCIMINARVLFPRNFYTITDDGIPILDNATSTPYPRCEDPKHRSTSQVEELKLDEPPPDTPNPNAVHTPTPQLW